MSSGGRGRLRRPRWRRLRRSSIARAAFRRPSSTARPSSGFSDASMTLSPTWPDSSRFRESGRRSAPSSPSTIRSSAIPSRDTATPRRRRRILTRLTDKKELGCYAFAEPLAGSDAGAIRHDGRRRWRSVRPQRPQAIRDERPPGTHRHRLCADRSIQGSRRLVGIHRRHRHAGFTVGETNEMLGLRASEAVDVRAAAIAACRRRICSAA